VAPVSWSELSHDVVRDCCAMLVSALVVTPALRWWRDRRKKPEGR
jgi:hypothetical protein